MPRDAIVRGRLIAGRFNNEILEFSTQNTPRVHQSLGNHLNRNRKCGLIISDTEYLSQLVKSIHTHHLRTVFVFDAFSISNVLSFLFK